MVDIVSSRRTKAIQVDVVDGCKAVVGVRGIRIVRFEEVGLTMSCWVAAKVFYMYP